MTLTERPEWQALKAVFEKYKNINLRKEFTNDHNRFQKFNINFNTPSGGKM